jgi:hypothetical protein
MDRQPVLFVTNCFGAALSTGVQRLTIDDDTGHHSKKMLRAPIAAKEYNAYMGATDVFDKLKLNRLEILLKLLSPVISSPNQFFFLCLSPFPPLQTCRVTCVALRLIYKNWSMRLFWSLMDMAHCNAYIIYRHFHPRVSHAAFFKQLAKELFYYGKGMKPPARVVQRLLHARDAKPASANVGSEDTESDEEVVSEATVCVPSKLKNGKRRPCFVCVQLNNHTESTHRKDTGSVRKLFPRSMQGCKTCNVPLCTSGGCWELYHQEFRGFQDTCCTGQWID